MTKRSIRGKRKVFSRHPENGKRPNGNGKEAAQKMFLEHAFIPIFTVRKDGVFLDMNKIAAKTLGGNPKDFIGSTMWELFPEKYAKLQLKSIRAAIRKRNVLITERQTVIGGKKRWYNTFIYPVKDENGKADSAVIMAEDITDKVEKDKEIDLKAKFLDSATDAIIMHDFSGRIIYFNEVAHKSLGYTGDEFKKLRLREIDAPWSADLIKSRTAELKRKKALKFEVEHKRKDGVLIPMEVLAKVIRVEGEDRVLSICRDISDRKKMENELRQREEQYAAVIRNIGVGVSLISKDMKVLSLNPLMRKWFPKVDPAKRPICYKAFNYSSKKRPCSGCPAIKTLKDGMTHITVTDTPTDRGIVNFKI
ncbi:PAS domain S-box protein, partial [Candidatus Woesearchaeota archaeon]|nr:PAS domain S-box protein [Candidatus Woesearchaeota archaeon]